MYAGFVTDDIMNATIRVLSRLFFFSAPGIWDFKVNPQKPSIGSVLQ
jgi:hypothetical protein